MQPNKQHESQEEAPSPINPKSSRRCIAKKAKQKIKEIKDKPNKKQILRKRKRQNDDTAESKEVQHSTKQKTIDKVIPRKPKKDALMDDNHKIAKLTPKMKEIIDNKYIRNKSNGDVGLATEYRAHVENAVGYKLSYGLYKAMIKRLHDLINGFVRAEPTELNPEMKNIIDKLYEERKGASIRMMDYRDELERRIDERISNQQWVQLRERVKGLNDGTILPSTQEQEDDLVSEGTSVQNGDEDGSTVTQKGDTRKVVTKEASNYTITNVLLEHCSSCTRDVFNDEKAHHCKNCKSIVHSECGTTYKSFSTHKGNALGGCLCVDCVKSASIFLCYPCGLTKLKAERYRIRVSRAKDSDLTQEWSLPKQITDETAQKRRDNPVKKKLTKEELEQQIEDKAVELQQWLKGIESVMYSGKNDGYYVKSIVSGEEKTKLLARDFMEESVLLLDEEFIAEIKKKENKHNFYHVSVMVKENVKHRAELWAGDEETYDNYNKCLGVEEWTHFKVNYHGATPITEKHKQTMHQINAKTDSTDINRDYYISLKNEALKVTVTTLGTNSPYFENQYRD